MSITKQTQNEPSTASIQQLELYEGAMCCETGVCGPSVDEQLLAVREDHRWAGIEPHGWLVNSTLTGTSTDHPTLRAHAQAESTHLVRIAQISERRTFSVAWQPQPPTGADALRTLATDTRAITSAHP